MTLTEKCMGGFKMGKQNILIAYDTQDNGLPVVVGTTQEVADYFGMSLAHIYSAICRGENLDWRYELVIVGQEGDGLEGEDE